MMAPFSLRRAAIVESNGGASMANATSLPDVDRMSFVSRILERHCDAVHRQRGQVGIPAVASVEFRGPLERVRLLAECLALRRRAGRKRSRGGWASKAPLHVTERSPRMFRVSSAFTWPAFGIPTRMPACCRTVGSDTVDSIRPKVSGGPA